MKVSFKCRWCDRFPRSRQNTGIILTRADTLDNIAVEFSRLSYCSLPDPVLPRRLLSPSLMLTHLWEL